MILSDDALLGVRSAGTASPKGVAEDDCFASKPEKCNCLVLGCSETRPALSISSLFRLAATLSKSGYELVDLISGSLFGKLLEYALRPRMPSSDLLLITF